MLLALIPAEHNLPIENLNADGIEPRKALASQTGDSSTMRDTRQGTVTDTMTGAERVTTNQDSIQKIVDSRYLGEGEGLCPSQRLTPPPAPAEQCTASAPAATTKSQPNARPQTQTQVATQDHAETLPEPQECVSSQEQKKPRRQPKKRKGQHANSEREPESLQEVTAYFGEKGYTDVSDPERFYNFYESNGWSLNNGRPLKNWKAAAANWHKNDVEREIKRLPPQQGYGDRFESSNAHNSQAQQQGGKYGRFMTKNEIWRAEQADALRGAYELADKIDKASGIDAQERPQEANELPTYGSLGRMWGE